MSLIKHFRDMDDYVEQHKEQLRLESERLRDELVTATVEKESLILQIKQLDKQLDKLCKRK